MGPGRSCKTFEKIRQILETKKWEKNRKKMKGKKRKKKARLLVIKIDKSKIFNMS
jgi:hypothetical protein